MKVAFIFPDLSDLESDTMLPLVAQIIRTQSNADWSFVIGIPERFAVKCSEFEFLNDVDIRFFGWEKAWKKEVSNALTFVNQQVPLKDMLYYLPADNCHNFHDCDYWLLANERTKLPLAPLKPYGVMPNGYEQRYAFNDFKKQAADFDDGFIKTVRHATHIFCRTAQDCDDSVQYCGAPKAHTHLLPSHAEGTALATLANDYWEAMRPYIQTTLSTSK